MTGLIAKYALRHRAIVLLLTALFILAGINALRQLPIEAYPDVTNVSVQVITLFPGRAAEEVERLVTIPIENEMNGIAKRISIRSISLFGLSQVTLTFEDNANVEFVRNQVSQHLAAVDLPNGAHARLSPNATPVGEIFRYTLQAPPGFSDVELKALQDWVVERQFRTVSGVVDVIGFGGPTKQYQVLINPVKLRSYNLSLEQVFEALSKANQNVGGSYIEHGPELYIVRGLGLIQSLDDIRATAIDTRQGTPVRISDVGEVSIGQQLRLGRVGKIIPGQPDRDDMVMGIIIMRRGENALEVLKRVHDKLEEINRDHLPSGMKLVPHYDRTNLTKRTLNTAAKNMAEGIGLVLLVLITFLGLGNYRSALIVAAVVPLSLLGAFLLLNLRNIPANLIALGAIDFGIIVDTAVIIVENVLHKLELEPGRANRLHEVIIEAVQQMSRPILFAKTILLTAFIPLFMLQSVEGKLFRPMALTLTFALITGTLLALTLIPALASFAMKNKIAAQESWIVRRLIAIYRPILEYAMRKRMLFLGGAVMLVVVAGIALVRSGTEFLPKLDEGSLWVRGFMPQTISPTDSNRFSTEIRRILASFPEVKAVVTQIGRPDDGTDINGWDVIECAVELKDRHEWKTARTREGLIEAMKKRLSIIPGIDFQFSQYIEDNVNEAVSGVKAELSIKIYGKDMHQLQALAKQIVELLQKTPGAADVSTENLIGQPQVQVAIDRAAIARYGLAIADVQRIVETAMGGSTATEILEGERTFNLIVKVMPEATSDLEAIRKLPVFGSGGERLTLGDITSVEVHTGFSRVLREGNARRTVVKFSTRGRDLGSLIAEAKQKIKEEVTLPEGYHLVWSGSFENQQRALERLKIIVPITLFVIFFLLFTSFGSGRLALLILMVVPFAAVGGILALPVAKLNLSVSALVGFMVLFGIAMLNGVILVERIRELCGNGMSRLQAVQEGAISRARPVVMTALMAALGLLPMALSTAVGAETSRPFAVVIIGGLFTATLVTLLILPILYPWFDDGKTNQREEL
ncbi:MAG: CusA/CzcA family heavy metal efflux RND transporter [Syntrophorhabdaceae bacterium]|nr:CusA/CzcA family heavy metal efflux RND transporter [Syntrophorhabdaceae bacterium]